jgi:hypothetical protein
MSAAIDISFFAPSASLNLADVRAVGQRGEYFR